ncbi:hypothetical protein LTR85_000155 [Meristemomyces frigidus]|nr:hypothetical protein LTR85_000155 [Meristemomyces frigidus]
MYGPERLQLRLKQSDAAKEAYAEWPKAQPQRAGETFASTTEAFSKEIEAIESRGKIPFLKEHIVTVVKQDIMIDWIRSGQLPSLSANPTYIPDRVLKTASPVILTRHPAKVIPSLYRTMLPLAKLQPGDEDFRVLCSVRWTRIMWDFFAAHPAAREPILIDADDLLVDAKAHVPKICGLLGISADGVEYSWDAVPKDYWPDDSLGITRVFIGSLLASTGLMQAAKAGAVDIAVETAKWEKEFGPEAAKGLRARVDAEMEDYEYLMQFKLSA